MERLTRLVGIGLLVGLVAWSASYYQVALEEIGDRVEAKQAAAEDSKFASEASESIIDQQPDPEYLAYRPGIKSGNYDIEDLEGSDDRDYELRNQDDEDEEGRDSDEDEDEDEDDRDEDEDRDEEEDEFESAFDIPTSGSLKPGVYATSFEVEDCRYQLHRVMKERVERTIGEDHLDVGRMIVVINEIEPDRFVATPECGDWGTWSPLVEPLKVAQNGDYWVGDLARGPWVVPEGCLWEKVVGFRGAKLYDVQESGRGPQRLVVNSDTLGVRIRDCPAPIVHDSLI